MDSSHLRNSSDLRNIVQLVQSERLRRPEIPQPDARELEATLDADGAKLSTERRQRIIQQLLNKRKQGSGEGSVQSANEGEHIWARSLGTNFPPTNDSTVPIQQAQNSAVPSQQLEQINRAQNSDEQYISYSDVPPPPPPPQFPSDLENNKSCF